MFIGPRNRFQGMNSASLCSLAGRYDNPIPTRCLAPIDFFKIPAQDKLYRRRCETSACAIATNYACAVAASAKSAVETSCSGAVVNIYMCHCDKLMSQNFVQKTCFVRKRWRNYPIWRYTACSMATGCDASVTDLDAVPNPDPAY